METTERIVEAYCRYIKKWATIPNIKCDGQYEIDLLAIDPKTGKRFHIESGVSISQSYSRLTNKPFSAEQLKVRVKKAGQRRTLGYFMNQKFRPPSVTATLRQYNFLPGKYSRVIVTWGWETEVGVAARRSKVELWDFRDILLELTGMVQQGRKYFIDDTLRTLQLLAKANGQANRPDYKP